MSKPTTDPLIVKMCEQVTAKRARAVIDPILAKGFVTTEELQEAGYDHAPRAARDVRESGIPLETYQVKSERSGRTIAAYKFGDPSKIVGGRIGGRKAFPKSLKTELLARDGSEDRFTRQILPSTALTVDHRIPYEVSGDVGNKIDAADFMLLDASSQRSKSWSCEHCRNWQQEKDPEICRACYWAYPESYSHMALLQLRRVDVSWSDQETSEHDQLSEHAKSSGSSMQDLVKRAIKDFVQKLKET